MNQTNNFFSSALKFHSTKSYPCSYLSEKLARSQVAAPDHLIDAKVYGKLIQAGFRRSGNYVYRPCCDYCHACIPVRINVDIFKPNRAQRRAWKQHHDLTAKQRELHFHPDHFSLYQNYQAKRHHGGGMDYDDREQYRSFLLQSNVNSKLIEFHEDKQLRMISIIDVLPDGLSSVYTFYDPDVPSASFGTYNILWQIQQCHKFGLPYLYLGYWIKENRKMSYKAKFQPLEILINGKWQQFNSDIY